uniref:Small nuclear ribonucleoprotein G n=1 Tax=Colletotrichum fructicola (strain Nara gc5) TaxID=1213859 RepID=L2FQR7_COLFN
MAPAQPELKKYLDKRLFVQLNGSRKVIGVLRGYDVFLNIVLDEAVEEKEGGEKVRLGMVVIRGNSVVRGRELVATTASREARFPNDSMVDFHEILLRGFYTSAL